MKRALKQYTAAALACVLAASLGVGCAKQPASSSASTAAATSTTTSSAPAPAGETRDVGGLQLPIANGDITIKLMRPDAPANYGGSLNTDTFASIEKIKENTGLNIVFDALPNDVYGDTLNTRLASGTDLPDAFVSGNADLTKLAKDGLIVDLKDYITPEITPNLVKFLEEYPEVYGLLVAPDGGIYGLPNRVSPFDTQFSLLSLGYRKDWADKVGVSDPQTMEDWYNMLTKFKNDDPNGNGEQDEIPVTCAHPNKIYDFSLAYGLSPWSNWFSTIDGKVEYDFTGATNSEKMKAYIEEMRKWYAEGLLDPDLGTEHFDKSDAKLLSNEVGVEQNWTSYWPYYNTQMQPTAEGVNWVTAMPIEGPFGDRGYENYPIMNNERFILTTQNKNIEATMKLYDYVFASKEGQLLSTCGIEGEHYNIEDGKVVFTDLIYKSDYENADAALMMQATGTAFPSVLSYDYCEGLLGQTMGETERATLKAASEYNRTMFPNVIATQEESDIITTKMTDIKTYQEEMFYKFILGAESMDQYDAFLAKLKDMGIDEVIAVKQAQYDRFIGK